MYHIYRGNGLYIFEGGLGEIEGNDVFDNESSGVVIRSQVPSLSLSLALSLSCARSVYFSLFLSLPPSSSLLLSLSLSRNDVFDNESTGVVIRLQVLPLDERWGAGVETQKMYGERLGDGVEYHLMKPTPRR